MKLNSITILLRESIQSVTISIGNRLLKTLLWKSNNPQSRIKFPDETKTKLLVLSISIASHSTIVNLCESKNLTIYLKIKH